MKINMELKGLEQLISNIQDYEVEKKKEVSNHVKDTAFKIQANAKNRAAVDTGHMKRNIKVEISSNEMSALIGTRGDDVEYSQHVEFGTSKTPAQPFLFPAHEDETPDYLKGLKDIMSDKQ